MGVVSPASESAASILSHKAPATAKMARVLFTLALLLVVFTAVRVYGAPTENSASPKHNRQGRTFGFSILGGRDWDEIRRWPFVTMTPPMKSIMSMFEEESLKESVMKRLEDLEQGHKRIMEYLQKTTESTSEDHCAEKPAEKLPKPVSVSESATAAPKLDVRVQTDAAAQPTSQAPTTAEVTTPGVKDEEEPTTAAKITTVEVEDKVVPTTTSKISKAEVTPAPTKIASAEVEEKEVTLTPTKVETEFEDKEVPPAPTKISSAEVEDKVVPPAPTKISSAEVEDKVVPPAPTKIASAEVEDKVVPPAPTKIASADVEDKVDPPAPTKISSAEVVDKVTPAEVEDKVEPSTTKITSGEVEDKSESLTPTKIASAEVNDKAEPTTRPQEVASSEESKEKVSTEMIETSQVDAEVPVTTATAETVADSTQETTTQFEETNDVNDILI